MKLTLPALTLALLLLGAFTSLAAITVPGADGSDGALNITANTVIDLSQAVTGMWDANNSANAGKGIYDPSKWAVVFKYSSVTIAAGTTVTFKNHASRAPVVWLVNGNVTINGTLSLNGSNGANPPTLAEPGPGGFRGGTGAYSAGVLAGPGFGVGGGRKPSRGDGGSYGTQGQSSVGNVPVRTYGNPSLIPLIGGSGGAGYDGGAGGGGGGGAILIACANTLTSGGQIRSNGGNGSPFAGDGSGGGIRLIANTLSLTGGLNAVSGTGGYLGGLGRIRIERVNDSSTTIPTPDPSIVPLTANDTALIWPPVGAPEVRIVSIGGQNIAADPRAEFGTIGADAVLSQTASTQIVIETTNVEQAAQVKVRGTPRANADDTEVNATVSTVVSTTPLVVRWTATFPVNVGYSAVQVKVIRP